MPFLTEKGPTGGMAMATARDTKPHSPSWGKEMMIWSQFRLWIDWGISGTHLACFYGPRGECRSIHLSICRGLTRWYVPHAPPSSSFCLFSLTCPSTGNEKIRAWRFCYELCQGNGWYRGPLSTVHRCRRVVCKSRLGKLGLSTLEEICIIMRPLILA